MTGVHRGWETVKCHVNWTLGAGLVLGVGTIVAVVFHGALEPYHWSTVAIGSAMQPPSWSHLAGTDALGRDEMSVVLQAYPYSIGVGAIGAGVAGIIGLALATLAAAHKAWITAVDRLADAAIALPFLVIAVVAIVVVGDGFWQTAIVLGIVSWPLVARVALAEARTVSERDYVVCARFMGVNPIRNVVRHILPDIARSIVVLMPFLLGGLILLDAALSLVGLGAPPSTPTFGNLLAASEDHLTNGPWLMAAPALALVITVVAANLLGDAIVGIGGSGVRVRSAPRQKLRRKASVDSEGPVREVSGAES